MHKRIGQGVGVALTWLVTLTANATHAYGQLEPDHVAIIGRFEQLQKWTCRFEMEVATDFAQELVPTPPPGFRVSGGPVNWRTSETSEFRFLRGCAIVTTELSQQSLEEARRQGREDARLKITSISPERVERLVQRSTGPQIAGGIDAIGTIPQDWILDLGLGLRLAGDKTWLEVKDLKEAAYSRDGDGNVTLTIARLDGQIRHELRFERQLEFALTSYRKSYPEDPRTYEETQCSEFRRVDGLLVPFKVVRFNVGTDPAGKSRRPFTWTLTVREFILNDPRISTRDDLLIVWPSGTLVREMRAGAMIGVGPTSRPLTDAAIAEEIKKQQREREELEQRARDRINRAGGSGSNPGTSSPAPAR